MENNRESSDNIHRDQDVTPPGQLALVAVPADGQLVAGHFASAYLFVLAEVGGGKVCNVRYVTRPKDEHGGPPRFLAGLGVRLVLAGKVGEQAERVLNESGIRVKTGYTGPIERALRDLACTT